MGRRTLVLLFVSATAALAQTAAEALQQAQRLRFESRIEEARQTLEGALRSEQDAGWRANLHFWLGVLHQETGYLHKAEASYRKAAELGEKSAEAGAATPLLALAELYLEWGRVDAAASSLRRALRFEWSVSEKTHRELLRVKAWVAEAQRQFEVAEQCLRAVVSSTEAAAGPESHAAASALNNLGAFLNSRNRHREAFDLLERASAILAKAAPDRHQDRIRIALNLAAALLGMRDPAAADSVSAPLIGQIAIHMGTEHMDMAHALRLRADILKRLGRKAEARAAKHRSWELMQSFQPHTVDRTELLAGR